MIEVKFTCANAHELKQLLAQLRAGTLDGCKHGKMWLVYRHEVEKLLGVSA